MEILALVVACLLILILVWAAVSSYAHEPTAWHRTNPQSTESTKGDWGFVCTICGEKRYSWGLNFNKW